MEVKSLALGKQDGLSGIYQKTLENTRMNFYHGNNSSDNYTSDPASPSGGSPDKRIPRKGRTGSLAPITPLASSKPSNGLTETTSGGGDNNTSAFSTPKVPQAISPAPDSTGLPKPLPSFLRKAVFFASETVPLPPLNPIRVTHTSSSSSAGGAARASPESVPLMRQRLGHSGSTTLTPMGINLDESGRRAYPLDIPPVKPPLESSFSFATFLMSGKRVRSNSNDDESGSSSRKVSFEDDGEMNNNNKNNNDNCLRNDPHANGRIPSISSESSQSRTNSMVSSNVSAPPVSPPFILPRPPEKVSPQLATPYTFAVRSNALHFKSIFNDDNNDLFNDDSVRRGSDSNNSLTSNGGRNSNSEIPSPGSGGQFARVGRNWNARRNRGRSLTSETHPMDDGSVKRGRLVPVFSESPPGKDGAAQTAETASQRSSSQTGGRPTPPLRRDNNNNNNNNNVSMVSIGSKASFLSMSSAGTGGGVTINRRGRQPFGFALFDQQASLSSNMDT